MAEVCKKIKRFLFRKLYYTIGTHLPSSSRSERSRKARGWMARGFLRQCGKDVNIEQGAVFDSDLSIGDHSGVGVNCILGGAVRIGNDVMMGPECIFYAHNHCFDNLEIPMRLQGFTEEAPVQVGDDVWFGARVMVMPGVTIGSHCVIAAGSVVTKNVPDYAVVGGVPAKVLKMRK